VKSNANARFWELFRQLPADVQDQARGAYRTFALNPKHPGLRFKRVSQVRPVYSVRVNRDYRALGILQDDAITWYWIGNHRDYDRFLATR
jgi:hypothetical protein